MKKWVVAWRTKEGVEGKTEPMLHESEAIDWEARMKCWWPERTYRRVVVETREAETVKDLAAPYRTT